MTMKRMAAVLVGLFSLTIVTTVKAAPGDTIIYLFRHGETIPTDPNAVPYDPHLNPAGKARAQELAKILRDVPVTRIFSTDLRRTLETATPLARETGREIEIYDPAKADGLVRELRSEPGVYAISGHSNTTPEVVGRLGGEPGSPIEHWEHDRLYILVYPNGAPQPTTILLRYGEVSKEP